MSDTEKRDKTLHVLREVVHGDPYHRQFMPLLDEIDRQRAAAKDSADHYADARAEIDRLRDDLRAQADWADWAKGEIDRLTSILAALREPSEAMVADAAEYVLGYNEPDYRDIRTAIVAAVNAAEQEVGDA